MNTQTQMSNMLPRGIIQSLPDSIINVIDIVLMANIILDQNISDIFSLDAADMNQDNIINILDIIELLNLILSN